MDKWRVDTISRTAKSWCRTNMQMSGLVAMVHSLRLLARSTAYLGAISNGYHIRSHVYYANPPTSVYVIDILLMWSAERLRTTTKRHHLQHRIAKYAIIPERDPDYAKEWNRRESERLFPKDNSARRRLLVLPKPLASSLNTPRECSVSATGNRSFWMDTRT